MRNVQLTSRLLQHNLYLRIINLLIRHKNNMGCGASVERSISKEWLALFRKLKLTRSELRSLFNMHRKFMDKSGKIDIVAWLTIIDLDRTHLTERIFMISDRDGDDKLNFYEFVLSMWKFCILGDHSLNVFAFDMYDLDSDGVLTKEEVHVMFRELLGKKHADTATNKFVLGDHEKHSVDGSMTVEHFCSFSKTHQSLFHEVFTIQRRMRKRTLGEQQWHSIGQRRIELIRGRQVQLCDLMILHSDRHLFESLLLDKNSRKAPLRASNRLLLELTENPHPHPHPHPHHTADTTDTAGTVVRGAEVESGLLVDDGDYCIGRPAEHTPTPAEQKAMQKKNKANKNKKHGAF